jgi:hypothetical protein
MRKEIESSNSSKECGHNNCSLINTEGCCACLDKRPVAKSYELYVDGQGFTADSDFNARYRHYCPSCRNGMNLPHVWEINGNNRRKDPIKQEKIRMDRSARRAAHQEATAAARAKRSLPPPPSTSTSTTQQRTSMAFTFRPSNISSPLPYIKRVLGASASSRESETGNQSSVGRSSNISHGRPVELASPPGYSSLDAPDSAPPPYTPRDEDDVSPPLSDQKPMVSQSGRDSGGNSDDRSGGGAHGNKSRWWTFFRR